MVTEINRMRGMGDLPSRLVSEVYISPEEVSLGELAERTGYSRSAVSEAMQNLVRSGIVKRMKKPGSRKVYFYMEKSLIKGFVRSFEKLQGRAVEKMNEDIPDIIEKYSDKESETAVKEKEIVKKYYRETQKLEEEMKKFIKRLKETEDDV